VERLAPASEGEVALHVAPIEACGDAVLLGASGVRWASVGDDVDLAAIHRDQHAGQRSAQFRIQLSGLGARGIGSTGELIRRPSLDCVDDVQLATDPAG